MKLLSVMKQMFIPAEAVGDIKIVNMDENWLGLMDRISITGVTQDGRKFELTLEIEKEAKKDGN